MEDLAGRGGSGSSAPELPLHVAENRSGRRPVDAGPWAEAMAKTIRDTTFIGEGGVAVVQRTLMGMRYAWQPTGRFDAGIDGYIELRDTQSKEMLGAHLGAQVKARRKFTRETDASFEFLCDQEDVDYWMRSNLPVLLICVRSDTEDAWFVCATDYFSDPDVRAERRVVFDKDEDRFDSGVANVLRDLALPPDAGIPRQGLTGPETLLTNLLPVHYGDLLWSAPTDYATVDEANERYSEREGPRDSDYLLRDGRLYSLRDPRTCELSRICDAARASSEPADVWANARDGDLRRRFADLLRRTMLQQFKPRIGWQPAKKLFYFTAAETESISMTGPSGHSREVVSVKRFEGKDGGERIGHIRHLAFRPRFIQFDNVWYLEVTPEWFFTWDGEREDRKADERRRWLKSRERNAAVSNHVRFWEHVITSQLGAVGDQELPLRFGPLRTERVAVGIDDRAWQGTKAKRTAKSSKGRMR
jgi:Domain of unknown function (DUF4365)